jgi:hypothetical protein
MNGLLMGVVYFVAAVISTVILIRLRPEWLLRTAPEVPKTGELGGLTDQEKVDYYRMLEYKSLYPSLPMLVLELARLRRGDIKALTYEWELGLDTIVTMVLSPFVLVLGIPTSIGIRGAVNSVNSKEKLRAAVEKELAVAKNEIDEFLHPEAKNGK